MDLGAGFASRRRARSRAVTVSIDSLNFIRRVAVGDTVSCYAELIKVGRTSMQFKMEAWTLSLQDDKHKKVAEGIFTFVAIDDEGKPHAVDRPLLSG